MTRSHRHVGTLKRLRLSGQALVRPTLAAVVAFGVLSVTLAGSASASDLNSTTKVDSTLVPVASPSAVPAGLQSLGPAPAGTPLHIDVALYPRDTQDQPGLAAAVSTPGNPSYRHFLTASQLTSRFGPSAATIDSVRTALVQAGLPRGRITADGLLISLTATAGQAERAFHTPIGSFRLPSGATAVANTGAPRLPASIAPEVQDVIGLNTVPKPISHPTSTPGAEPASAGSASTATRATPVAAGPQPCAEAQSKAAANDAYTGNQLAQAYSFDGLYNQGDLGAGATIALVEFEPYDPTDIAAFQACYGTNTTINNMPAIDGGVGTGSGSSESALDLETLIELAPEATIDVYDAPYTDAGEADVYGQILDDDTAQVVSISYAQCEATFRPEAVTESQIFYNMALKGQSVFAASGDQGSEECLPNGSFNWITTDTNPDAVAVDSASGTVYVANSGSGTVSVFSESQMYVLRKGQLPVEPVADPTVGADPDGVAVDPSNHDVYVTNFDSDSVSVIAGNTCDAANQTNCSATTISALDQPTGIAIDPSDDTVYVSDWGSGTVSVISDTSNTIKGTVSLGSSADAPYDIAFDTSTHRVYVADYTASAVYVITGTSCNASTQTSCASTPPRIGVGANPSGVAVSSTTNTVYVTNFSGSVSVINGATNAVSATISAGVPDSPIGIALSPSGNQVLVTGRATATVAVIATATDSVTSSLDVGTNPDAVAVDASTGFAFTADYGSADMSCLQLFLNVGDPASQQNVTAVGGTDLTSLDGPIEKGWNSVWRGYHGASGGGLSSIWALPPYQTSIVNSESGCPPPLTGDCREVPDVSAAADPTNGYLIYYEGAWIPSGGTSAATPLWAALTALAVVFDGHVTTYGNLNGALYLFASEGDPDFNDVTTGDNDETTTNAGQYAASTGYDMDTGLGSPKGSALAADLFAATTNSLEITSTALPSGVVRHFYSATLTASGGNPPYTWFVSSGGLPKGLHLKAATGVISGNPKVTGTVTFVVEVVDRKTKTKPHTRNTATATLSLTIGP